MSAGAPVPVEPVEAFLVIYDPGNHGHRVLSDLRTDGFEGIKCSLSFSGLESRKVFLLNYESV